MRFPVQVFIEGPRQSKPTDYPGYPGGEKETKYRYDNPEKKFNDATRSAKVIRRTTIRHIHKCVCLEGLDDLWVRRGVFVEKV
uniref:Uncharacterized protein n=1 Tax=Panagrellus redivivus TaxID=6233 RepID=A0A7E4V4P8_PANRE